MDSTSNTITWATVWNKCCVCHQDKEEELKSNPSKRGREWRKGGTTYFVGTSKYILRMCSFAHSPAALLGEQCSYAHTYAALLGSSAHVLIQLLLYWGSSTRMLMHVLFYWGEQCSYAHSYAALLGSSAHMIFLLLLYWGSSAHMLIHRECSDHMLIHLLLYWGAVLICYFISRFMPPSHRRCGATTVFGPNRHHRSDTASSFS